jgi:hypothetical protein
MVQEVHERLGVGTDCDQLRVTYLLGWFLLGAWLELLLALCMSLLHKVPGLVQSRLGFIFLHGGSFRNLNHHVVDIRELDIQLGGISIILKAAVFSIPLLLLY